MRPSNPLTMLPLVTTCFLALLPAQDPTVPGGKATVPGQPEASGRVSIQFKGGSLKDYVQAIRAAADDVNIVLPDKADRVQLPPVTLKNAPILSALEAVTTVVDREEYQISVKPFHGPGAPVFAVRVDLGRSEPRGGLGVTRVLSLRTITEAPPLSPNDPTLVMGAETVLTAVKAGLAVASLAPQVKYHAESGLLFVQGPTAAAELVNSVLRQIESDLTGRRNEAVRAAVQKAAADTLKKAAEGK